MESLLRVVGISARALFAALVSFAVWVGGVGVMADTVRWLGSLVRSLVPGQPNSKTSWSELTEPVRPSEELAAFGERVEWSWLATQANAVTAWVDTVQPRWEQDELLLIPFLGLLFTGIAIVRYFVSDDGVPFTAVASGWASILIAAELGAPAWQVVALASVAILALGMGSLLVRAHRDGSAEPGPGSLTFAFVWSVGLASPLVAIWAVFYSAD